MATGVSTDDRADAVIANVPGAVYRCRLDASWTMELISDEIERISGYPAEEFLGSRTRSFASIIHPDDRSHVEAVVAQAVSARQTFAPEYRIVRADGSVAWVLERGRATAGPPGSQQRLDGIIFDITERKVLEDELRRSLTEEAAAQERLRLARDLHDSVGHALTIGTIQAGVARGAIADDPAAAAAALTAIESSLRTAMTEMRAMVRALHDDGQAARDARLHIEELAGSARQRGLHIDLRVTGDERPLPAVVEVSLYRTAQECLTNCAKYAAGAAVSIELHYDHRYVTLVVSDDGTGCAEPTAGTSTGGRGLEGIRERAEGLGGRYEANPLSDGGFQVAVAYPA